MDQTVISRITDILTQRFYERGIDNFDLDTELNISDPVKDRQLTAEEKHEAGRRVLEKMNYKKSYDGAVLKPISVIDDPREHEKWYDDWLVENNNEIGRFYWKNLENYLSSVLTRNYGPEKAGEIVKSIDEATYGIMEKLANPKRTEFSYKGLVVGYVQSGKTANFSALIAKAVDAGYKFIIVLSGIHNILRLQTQIRLDKELTGMNDHGLEDDFVKLPPDIKKWNRLSTANNDFADVNLNRFNVYCTTSSPVLVVTKKNVTLLDKLIEFIKAADETNRAQMPLLLIDDEADQASIDIKANSPDTLTSKTNGAIRSLLALFQRKTYIGYTATPFANVLTDKTTEHPDLEDDLYPRNFIVSLPEPEGYIGTATIFEGNLSDIFVREIPDERNTLTNNQMTVNLMRSIDEFIICCAVRNIREDRQEPMSMLIHVSHKISDMGTVRGLVEEYFNNIRTKFGDKEGREKMRDEYNHIWEEFRSSSEAINRELSLNNHLPDSEEIWNEINNVLSVVSILELNSDTEDRLDYTTGEEIKVIAIGGNQLSRGLTLEGLMTSYYLRESRQYDTLLQMGRWFGYRKGYEDLTRVHTSIRIWESFEHLALVEEEIRGEMYRYEEEEGRTPAEMAIPIRDHRFLNVTARNKMGAAVRRQISYSESLNQTICLPLNRPDHLKKNYELGENFIKSVNRDYKFDRIDDLNLYLAIDVPGDLVLTEFLNKYVFVDKESSGKRGLDSYRMLSYIYRRLNHENRELKDWRIALVGNEKPTSENRPVEYGGFELNRVQRSRKHTEAGYNIGVLTEPDHLRIDLPPEPEDDSNNNVPYYIRARNPQNPLLLLYVVWSESKARVPIPKEKLQPGQRINLYEFIDSEKIDVLSLAIILPRSACEPFDYVGQ